MVKMNHKIRNDLGNIKHSKNRNYLRHENNLKGKVKLLLQIIGISALIAWLFYDSWLGLIWILPVGILLVKDWKQENFRRQQFELEQQFQTGLVFAAGALETGYSLENAWKETEKDILQLYGEQAIFTKILHQMNQRVSVNEPLEILVWELGQNSQSENIRSFSEVFFFARKSGGNMTAVMRRCANRIGQNFQIQEELQLALASRQLELAIMHGMPFGILGYLRFGSAEFLDPLYHNVTGVFIMTGCVLLYGFTWWLSKKLIQIRV